MGEDCLPIVIIEPNDPPCEDYPPGWIWDQDLCMCVAPSCATGIAIMCEYPEFVLDPIEKCSCIPKEEYDAYLNHGLDENCLPPVHNDDDCCCHNCCDCHDNQTNYVRTIGNFDVVHVSGQS